MRAAISVGRLLFGQTTSRVGVLDNPRGDNLFTPNIPDPLENSSASQESLDLSLITALKNSRGKAQDEDRLTQTVSELLTRGANVNAVTSYGSTPLMLAAGKGHKKIVLNFLSRKEINVNATRPNGATALMLAAEKGHTEIVSDLLSHDKININAARLEDNTTALMFAAQNGHTEIVLDLLSREEINVNVATTNGTTALIFAAYNGHTETVLALLSRDGIDWQEVQGQLRHPALQNLNKEVSFLLAVTLPDEELRNSIITSFNQKNRRNAINQENNDILGAGIKAYKNLKDLKSWHVRYLTDSGAAENKAQILANKRFFDLLNHQDSRKEASARDSLVTDLVSKSASLAADFERIAKGIKIEDQEALKALRGLSPEDFYKLTTKIIDKSKTENNGIPKLQSLSLVAALRNFEIDPTSPATTIRRKSIVPTANSQKNFWCCVFSQTKNQTHTRYY